MISSLLEKEIELEKNSEENNRASVDLMKCLEEIKKKADQISFVLCIER